MSMNKCCKKPYRKANIPKAIREQVSATNIRKSI